MALGVADYVYIISKGVVVYESSPDKLGNNEEAKAKYLGAASS
jgi:ABC-type lipopolysaccharide export system ATPase subunit